MRMINPPFGLQTCVLRHTNFSDSFPDVGYLFTYIRPFLPNPTYYAILLYFHEVGPTCNPTMAYVRKKELYMGKNALKFVCRNNAFLHGASSRSLVHVCKQQRLWRDCAYAQSRLSLYWLPM